MTTTGTEQDEGLEFRDRIHAYLYTLLSLILFCGTLLFVPVGPKYLVSFGREERILQNAPMTGLFLLILFLGLFFLHHKIYHRVTPRAFLIIASPVVLAYFTAVPFFDGDVFIYAFKGLLKSSYGISPYVFCPSFDTVYQAFSIWIFVPEPYGPLACWIFSIVHVASGSPFLNMYILKVVFVVGFSLLAWVAMRKIDDQKVFFLLLSPLVLVLGIHSPHIGLFSLLLVFLGFLFLKEDHLFLCFVALGLAVAVKASNLVFLMAPMMYALKLDWKKSFYILSSLAIIIATIFLIDTPANYLSAMLSVAAKKGTSLHRLFGFHPVAGAVLGVVGVAYLGFITSQFWRRKIDVFQYSYLSYILALLLMRNVQPWYYLPAYGVLIFMPKLRFDVVGLSLLIGMFCGYFLLGGWTPAQGYFASVLASTGLLAALGMETNWQFTSADASDLA